ncbi:hypothetical protein Sjap_022797 [Stephania japonica]|uniref:Glycosyltransferase n=1 Tax=Stephania japonica TaxID=461633 RepID=A0AAP0EPJ2_9MAGN
MDSSQEESKLHVLMVSFPGQGHINPLLRLAKCLASKGLSITFTTTANVGKMLENSNKSITETTAIGSGDLRFEFFSDGWEDDDPRRHDLGLLVPQIESSGRDFITRFITQHAQDHNRRPVSCIINNAFIPWVVDVATEHGIPSAVLWVQSIAVYSVYYHYFHKLASFPTPEDHHASTKIPGLPPLDFDEIPSFLHPSSPYVSLQNAILEQFKNLSKAFRVLVDSFDELEHEQIKIVSSNLPASITTTPLGQFHEQDLERSEIKCTRLLAPSSSNAEGAFEDNKTSTLSAPITPVGPLIKFSTGNEAVRADMWSAADECLTWLDSHPPSSVVYVSFGSVVSLSEEQLAEMAFGLLDAGVPFLWSFRPPFTKHESHSGLPEEFLEHVNHYKKKCLIVKWAPQDHVLAHPSVACFVTHCGWNSTLESLSSGVPVVAFPQWGDQVTDAKFLADVFGVGVRLVRSCEDLKNLSRGDVERCIREVTSGEKAEEMRKNALKWRKAAEDAVAPGGSSDRNVEAFVDEIKSLARK